jgi:glutamate-5-semialdehyde dehydrogenase
MTEMQKIGASSKRASRVLMTCGTNKKNEALRVIAESLVANTGLILEQNRIDVENARQNGISDTMTDRLALTAERIEGMARGVYEIIALEDPVGKVTNMSTRPNGLIIGRKTVPMGVIAMIYESRPNVTVDAAVLCLKAGNAVILRGGKEAINSNTALEKIMRDALSSCELPADLITLVKDTSRDSAVELMGLTEYVDVLIPRGGASLIRSVVENAKIPVIETGVGVCHVYVDRSADMDMAADIIYNAKCSRPSVCNAAETLLIHAEIASEFLPKAKRLLDGQNVRILGCAETVRILGSGVIPASEEDYFTEHLDYILSVKVVSGLSEAIEHITKYGSGHSEAIVTGDYAASQAFLEGVDAAAVYVNASTRFTDGGEFGLGAEIGISTQKLHARGPLGLNELTSGKFIIYGSGQIRI